MVQTNGNGIYCNGTQSYQVNDTTLHTTRPFYSNPKLHKKLCELSK